jgi:hypothetical protein
MWGVVEINGRGLTEFRRPFAGRVHEFHVLVFDPSHPATEITDSPDHAGCLQSPRFAAASPQVGFRWLATALRPCRLGRHGARFAYERMIH